MFAALSFARPARADDGATPPVPEPSPQSDPVAPPSESSPPEAASPVPFAPPSPAPPPSPAASPEPLASELGERSPRFGAKGSIVVTAGVDVSIGSTSYDNSSAESFVVTFAPGASYFIVDGVSIGLEGTIAHSAQRSYGVDDSLVGVKTTAWSIGPRAGVNVWLSRILSLYPRLTLGLESVRRDERVIEGASPSTAGNPLGIPSTTRLGPYASLFVPLLLHPAPHVFFEVGPSLFHELGRAGGGPEIGGQRTSIGAGIGVGTWWGGKTDRVPSQPAERTPAARFGDERTLVLGGRIGGSYTSYAGTRSETAGLSVGPAIDYFITERFSVGLGVAYHRSHRRALQSTGAEIEQSSNGISFAPRVGIDFPITSRLSLYPQAAVSFGSGSITLESAGSRLEYSETTVTVSGFAPLLIHAAPHAFIGFGPYVTRDAEREVEIRSKRGGAINGGKVDNPGTSVGASLVVGGWL